MDKMRMESVNLTAQNVEKIGAMFPNCVTETIDENGKPRKRMVMYIPTLSAQDDTVNE